MVPDLPLKRALEQRHRSIDVVRVNVDDEFAECGSQPLPRPELKCSSPSAADTPRIQSARLRPAMSALQRLESLTDGGRTHGERHQADIRFSGRRHHERQQCEVQLTSTSRRRGLAASDRSRQARWTRTDPYQSVDALRSCPTTGPAYSRFASTKPPFVAYGGRPQAGTGERPLHRHLVSNLRLLLQLHQGELQNATPIQSTRRAPGNLSSSEATANDAMMLTEPTTPNLSRGHASQPADATDAPTTIGACTMNAP